MRRRARRQAGLSPVRVILAVAVGLTPAPALAAETVVAVAANFTRPAEEIAAAFTARTGDRIVLSFGASGALYAQITQAAPFTVYLSADNKRPAQAVKDGLGVEGTVFTYAIGKSALYSPAIDVTDGEAVLKAGAFQHVAIADPTAAPYGAAAMEVIDRLGLSEGMAPKIVSGENITQALQFVETGNAEIGFVALSQVIDRPPAQVWTVPAGLYTPILQDAVLLTTGENDPVAKAFHEFLKSDEAHAIIEKYGYETARN
jgi:molybdate transport system substrate-binding protein